MAAKPTNLPTLPMAYFDPTALSPTAFQYAGQPQQPMFVTVQPPTNPVVRYDPDCLDSLYSCCFWPYATRRPVSKFIYIHTGIEIVSFVVAVILSILAYVYFASWVTLAAMIGTIVYVVVGFVLVCLVCVGVSKKRPMYILPHIVFQILAILGLIACLVLFGLAFPVAEALFYDLNYTNSFTDLIWATILVIWEILFQVAFIVAELKAFRMLRRGQCIA